MQLATDEDEDGAGHAGGDTRVLEVDRLRTEFRLGDSVHRAVGGVSFGMDRTECLGLVGESGCGKSVTAMSLTGLVPSPPGTITGGRVLLDGEDLLRVGDTRLRRLRGGHIAHVFQDPLTTLHPLFTVGYQLVEAIRVHQPLGHRAARERAAELLDMVRIPNARERLHAYPHELSGGMRQRVCIAMALANDTEVVVADEPTTALDVTVQAQILRLLDDLRHARRAAVLFITHDFGVVSEVCDRVAVMYAGRIVETGPTGAVLGAPAHPYTRMLIDCVPVMGRPGRRLQAIAGLPPSLDSLPAGCAFAERCPSAQDDCRRGELDLTALDGERAVRCLHPVEGAR
jgi:peptide/nickel transport system permease protein